LPDNEKAARSLAGWAAERFYIRAIVAACHTGSSLRLP